MTNLRSIATKSDEAADKLAAKIAQLREFFDPNYKPQFRVGDIVRLRPAVARLTADKNSGDYLFIVHMVRQTDENWISDLCDTCDDIIVVRIEFEKEEQRKLYKRGAYPSWQFEFVDRLPDPSEA